jgi:hypothetical protein
MRRYIWVQPATQVRWLWKPLIELVGQQIDATPLLLVNSPEDRDYYQKHLGRDFAGVIVIKPDIYSMTVNGEQPFSEDEAAGILADFERRYGVLFMRDMLVSDRHLGRAYLHGADGLPSSRTSERVTPGAILTAGAVYAKFFEDLLQSHPPALMIVMSGGVGLQGKPLAAIARRLKVPFRNLVHTRFGSRYYWAEDEFGNSAALNRKLDAEPAPSAEQIETVLRELRPTGNFEYYGELQRRRARIWPMFKYLVATAIKHARYHVGGSRKARVGYSMLGEMRMIVRARRHRRALLAPQRPMAHELPANRRIVFFLLQVEPEISLHGLAPLFIDQLHTVNQISMHLPADALLVVKEHPVQVGRRSDAFYEKLAAMPNVALLNDSEQSYAVMRRADLVIAVTSSAAHEAAVMGRRVAYLSDGGPLTRLPYVRQLRSTADFDTLSQMLEPEAADGEARRAADGVRWYLGLKRHAVSFDKLGKELFDANRRAGDEEIREIAATLLDTLQPVAARPRTVASS